MSPKLLTAAKEGRATDQGLCASCLFSTGHRAWRPRRGGTIRGCWFQSWLLLLDGDWAHKNSVLEEDADHQEHKVEAKHDEAQDFVHPPLTKGNGEDDKEQHDEEEDNGAEEAIAADGHGLESVDDGVQEPGQREPMRERSRGRQTRWRRQASAHICCDNQKSASW